VRWCRPRRADQDLPRIVVNLLSIPDCYGIALRDFGPLAAVALARLAQRDHGERQQP
jgi:hypothetical protein